MDLVVDDLRAALGRSHVATDEEAVRAASHGTWPVEVKLAQLGRLDEQTPRCVVDVSSADEVATVLAVAAKHRTPVVPMGGRSGIVGAFRTASRPIALSLRRLDRLELDPVSMTVWAGTGVTIQELEDWLQARGFTCGHFPQSMQLATVGGMVATNGTGTFSTKYGRMRDLVQCLDVVLADGRRLRTQPGPDASTGPDLRHLFIGSEGTLGVVTAAQLQVWPRPERRWLTAFAVPAVDRGLEALRQIVAEGIRPALVRLYDEAEAAGLWRAVSEDRTTGLLILGQEGRADLGELELDICRRILAAHGAEPVGEAPAAHWFAHRFDWVRIPEANRRPGGIADAIEISAAWSTLPAVWRASTDAVRPLCTLVESHVSHVYHVGGSVYVIFFAQADDDAAAIALYDRILDQLLTASLAAGGNVSHHHGIGTAKVRWFREQLGEGSSVLTDLKRALDPEALLSPGVLGLGAAVSPLPRVPYGREPAPSLGEQRRTVRPDRGCVDGDGL